MLPSLADDVELRTRGCEHTERRMATLAVVKDLQVLKHRVSELNASAPSFSVEQLDLHPTPKGLHHRTLRTACLPVAGNPNSGPECVAVNVTRAATLSCSAIRSSIVTWMSENACCIARTLLSSAPARREPGTNSSRTNSTLP